MVHLIHTSNRQQHAALLESMFRDRKRVFVDGLKWPLDVDDTGQEIDAFDTPASVYLVDAGADGRHQASIRLLPTEQPHLLASHFGHLVHDDLPSGPQIWEITRFCANPSLRGVEAQWAARKRVLAAMVEYALLHDIERLVFVTHGSFVPKILSVG